MSTWLADNMGSLAADGSVALIALAVIAALVFIVIEAHTARARAAEWRLVAAELGLQEVKACNLEGNIDGLEVHAHVFTKGSGKNRRTYTGVRVWRGLPETLTFAREGFFSQLMGADLKTGDPAFDQAVVVRGDLAQALALLDDETRDVVRAAIVGGWRYENAAWVCEVSGRLRGHEVQAHIESGLALARRFREAARALPDRLADRVQRDSKATTRLAALELLIERHARTPATDRALRAASSDRDAAVRLAAARYLNDKTLLLPLALGPDEPEAIEALGVLASRHPGSTEAGTAARAWLDAHAGASHRAKLALLDALGQIPHERAEAVLIEALHEGEPEERKLAAMRSLGRVGTVAAVAALLPYREKLLAFTLKAAAKEAILAIQARQAGAEAGALSLAGEGGGLALAEDEGERAPVPTHRVGEVEEA